MTIPTEARPNENPWSKLNMIPQSTISTKTKICTTELCKTKKICITYYVTMDVNDEDEVPNYQREVKFMIFKRATKMMESSLPI